MDVRAEMVPIDILLYLNALRIVVLILAPGYFIKPYPEALALLGLKSRLISRNGMLPVLLAESLSRVNSTVSSLSKEPTVKFASDPVLTKSIFA
jgi:hypothetical protein